jgi:excisionase family DNA binding protein
MKSKSAQLLSLEDTALVLGIGRSTMYRAVRDGRVPFPVHRIGGKWYVPKRALERFLDGEEPVGEEDAPTRHDAQNRAPVRFDQSPAHRSRGQGPPEAARRAWP